MRAVEHAEGFGGRSFRIERTRSRGHTENAESTYYDRHHLDGRVVTVPTAFIAWRPNPKT